MQETKIGMQTQDAQNMVLIGQQELLR
ncbi:hypothetical protein Cabther_A1483 [Chloracidobacterium thermophilum B]|uniref:Uncharacterized protein n=1 Tax=Chloracidobacterium thermophilum (strain B) TaxID=981222 RepID=G2LHH0_CHLTF|nr:hypothetical protein Cabther_A1483 [Chloracidobacterium thermophilum B]